MDKKINSNISGIYTLTPLQQAMLFYRMLDASAASYVEQSEFQINGLFNNEKFEDAAGFVTERYDVLRSAVISKGKAEPLLVFFHQRKTEFNYIDLSDCGNSEERMEQIKLDDIRRNFDLSRDAVMRITAVKFSETKYRMLWSFHHIYMDGWSFGLVKQKCFDYYYRLMGGETKENISREIMIERSQNNDFGEYLKWMKKQDKEKAELYWKHLLEKCEVVSEIPSISYEKKGKGISEEIIFIDEGKTEGINKVCTYLGVTVNTFIETALGILITRYTHSDCAVFGKIVSGRDKDIEGAGEMVGLLINTIPCVVGLHTDIEVSELLHLMKTQALESMNYDYFPLPDIQNMSVLRENMIKLLFCFENYYVEKQTVENGERDIEIISVSEETNYDLTVSALAGEEIIIKASYRKECYTNTEIRGFLEKFAAVVGQMAENPAEKVSKLKCITEKEEEEIRNCFNKTGTDYPCEKTIIEIFEEMAEKYADDTAIISKDGKLTYGELNYKANLVAAELIKAGIGADDFVAIMVEKAPETIVGICGILKAGGAYVPIDPSYPRRRISYILTDCRPRAVLYSKETLAEEKWQSISLKDIMEKQESAKNPDVPVTAENLASCIYTSGTTGNPKGSLITHRNIIRLVKNINYINLDRNTVIMQTGSMSFDASTLEIWGALLNGGKCVIANDGVITNGSQLKKYIGTYGVNTMWMTSTLFNQMIQIDHSLFDGLKYLLIGGEKLSDEHVKILKKHNQKIKLINGYGPTENTTFTTTYEIPEDFDRIPIGRPIANTQVYVMDGKNLCGIGIPGELCTTGAGVSRGYLNQPELTADRFVKNPFGEGKMYRTNDLARWLPDGNIDYLGRMDDQVKIRGFRIEPGEIETVIRRIKGIKDCVVIARTDETGDKALWAYIVADVKMDFAEVRKLMQASLPDYMIPVFMMQIESIPISGNGKLDKKALPKMENKSEKAYVAPRNSLEAAVCKIFGEILKVEKVGINDNFFELGGHSLRATRLVNQIEADTGFRMELKEVFTSPTPVLIAEVIKQGKKPESMLIPRAVKKAHYTMSSAQKRIFLICQMDMGGITYNMPQFFRIKGTVEPERMRAAYKSMLERHEILKTGFEFLDGVPVQIVHDAVQEDFVYLEDKDTDEDSLMASFVRPFCLDKPPLVRILLVNRQDSYLLFLDFHHIVGDGMSIGLYLNEFAALYKGKFLGSPGKQYYDYSEWMRAQDLSNMKKYWISQFNDSIPVLDMVYDYKRPMEQSFEGGIVVFESNTLLCTEIKELAQKKEATDFMVLLAGAMVLLSKYSHQNDIVIGSAFSGRIHKETEEMLGMFVNTLPLRGRPEPDKKFSVFLTEIKEICMQAYQNQEFPFEELIESLGIQRDLSRNPLFDVMFALQNNESIKFSIGDSPVELLGNEGTTAKFDLTFNIFETDRKFVFGLEYSTALFREDTIQRMAEHYNLVMEQITRNPEIRLGEISVVTDKEKENILNIFNDTAAPYPSEKTIMQIFEEVVREKKENIAIVYGDRNFTYEELNHMVNSVAVKLRRKGIGRNDIVAVISGRSIEMFAAILGIMKAGGAYVPIDPSYPSDRIKFILSDCAPKVVLIHDASVECEIPVMEISTIVNDLNCENPVQINKPDDLAYLIYTSGTTGRPKGVLLEHRGLVAVRSYLIRLYQVEDTDNVLQFANYVFDASVWEMILGLFTGASLILVSTEIISDTQRFKEYVEKNKVTLTLLPPQYYLQTEICGLKVLTTGGSASNGQILSRAHENARYINAYGPTENTVLATHWEYNGENVEKIPIGRPISNTHIYIMDRGRLCGIGVPGELCITGAGVARGYLNCEDLTREKFVEDPYGVGKMYRSGDLARWLPDGNIEYLGRMDEQVKVRGYRIELGEIENVMRKTEGIQDCAVIIKTDEAGNNVLYGYLVSAEKLDMPYIRTRLLATLPDYMIPTHLLQIDEIPVTKSGKVDKKILAAFVAANEKNYVEPVTDAEKVLCRILADSLKIERVGINDNFFELGGDSIKAISLISDMRKYDYELTVKDVMAGKVVGKIAANAKKNAVVHYDQGECNGSFKPLPVMDYYMHNGRFGNISHFNQTMMLCREKIDREAIRAVLNQIIWHHDILRMAVSGKEVYIRACNEIETEDIAEIDIRGINSCEKGRFVEEECTKIQKGFNLQNGPLYRFAIFTDKDREHLFLCLHHFVVDGISWRILMEDINNSYDSYKIKKEIILPAKTASFPAWTKTVWDYKNSKEFKEEKNYWLEVIKEMDELNPVWQRNLSSGIMEEKSIMIDEETISFLMRDASEKYGTGIQEILLAALSIAFGRNGSAKKHIVKLEGHGRQMLHKKMDVSRTVGWFTIVYPFVLSCCDSIEDTLLFIKEKLKEIPNNGFGYGLLQKNMQFMDISFNYLGQIGDGEEHEKGFGVSEFSCGTNISKDNQFDETFMFTASIYHGEMGVTINYDTGNYEEEMIQSIVSDFMEALKDIARLSVSRKEKAQTLSDIGAKGELKTEIFEINKAVGNMNREDSESLDDLLSVF